MRRALVCMTAILVLLAGAASGQQPGAWSEETLRLFELLPVQDAGRVKPMRTYADFTLLAINGARTFKDAAGQRRTATAWLLDVLFFPHEARRYPIFIVPDAALLDAIGIAHEGRKRRDRYAYEELLPGRERLFELGSVYQQTPAAQRTNLQSQLVALAENVFRFEQLAHHFDFARATFGEGLTAPTRTLLGAVDGPVRYSDLLARGHVVRFALLALDRGMESLLRQAPPGEAEALRRLLPEGLSALDDATRAQAVAELDAVLRRMDEVASRATALAVIPPAEHEEWHTPGGLVEDAFLAGPLPPQTLDLLREWEALAPAAAEGPAAFEQALRIYHDHAVAAAKSAGGYETVPLEVTYYRLGFFRYALMLFVLSFIVVALSWLKPASRVGWGVSVASVVPPLALLTAGITMRCVIRGRPPVTTLYETILFVTAVAVLVALAVELMNRRRVAVAVAAALGLAGMFLANRYEVKEGVDTMPAVIAVLDTNFWLATHVTTVTMGYSAGLLAGAIAHVYVFARLFGLNVQRETYEALTRMVYGVICFGLLFALVGTVLGGIWAAQSWGRFWGWDPKENGALMIVLCELAILHARKGGYIRAMGMHLAAVFNAMVVAFSWWGVNLLGVGLHSYGFTSGVMRVLAVFLLVETAVIALGGFAWARDEGLLAPKQTPESG